MALVDLKADDCTLTSLLRRSRCRSTQRCRRHWLVVNHAARPRSHVRATDCCACYGDRLPFRQHRTGDCLVALDSLATGVCLFVGGSSCGCSRGAHVTYDFSWHSGGIPGSFLPCDDPAAPSHQTIEPPLESLAHEFGRGDCRVYDRIRAVHRAAQRAGIYRVRNEWRRIFGIRGGKRNPALRWQASYVRYIGRTRAACPHTWTCHRHRIVRRFDDCETSRPETPDAYVRASH